MKKTSLVLAGAIAMSLAGCAASPITPTQIQSVSTENICVLGAITTLTGGATWNGHPVPVDVLANEGLRRGLTCQPHEYYDQIARYRLQQQEIAQQREIMAIQAVSSSLDDVAQQYQQRAAINAQQQAAYYQQQQATLAAQAQAQREAQQQQAASMQQALKQDYQQQQIINAIKAPATTTCTDPGYAVTCTTTH